MAYVLFALWINIKPWDRWQAHRAIETFSKDMAAGNYGNAARYIGIPEGRNAEEFRAEWSFQMADLKSAGTYMASYRKIRTYVDDMALQGRAVWTIYNNYVSADYEVLLSPQPNSTFSLYFIPLSDAEISNKYKDLLR